MQVIAEPNRLPIKMWTDHVPVEQVALQQLKNISSLPFIYKHVAVMPDVHWGMGATVGSVIATKGAGRVMSRNEASKKITLEDHIRDTQGVECRKDKDVIDESPKAYKNIDDVMKSQEDLVEIVATLKQVLCVKG